MTLFPSLSQAQIPERPPVFSAGSVEGPVTLPFSDAGSPTELDIEIGELKAEATR